MHFPLNCYTFKIFYMYIIKLNKHFIRNTYKLSHSCTYLIYQLCGRSVTLNIMQMHPAASGNGPSHQTSKRGRITSSLVACTRRAGLCISFTVDLLGISSTAVSRDHASAESTLTWLETGSTQNGKKKIHLVEELSGFSESVVMMISDSCSCWQQWNLICPSAIITHPPQVLMLYILLFCSTKNSSSAIWVTIDF